MDNREPKDILREKLRNKIKGCQQARTSNKTQFQLRKKEDFDMMEVIRQVQDDKFEKGLSVRVLRHKYEFLLKEFEPIFNMATQEEPLTEKELEMIENMLKHREKIYNNENTQDQATVDMFKDLRDMKGV